MLKKTILIFLFFISLSCKNNENAHVLKSYNKESKTQEKKSSIEKKVNPTNTSSKNCIDVITALIESSNIKNPFKDNLSIDITENNSVNMKIRLFDRNDKLENTVGWVVFDAENVRLLDITNDIENPVKLNFDQKLWNKVIECSFDNNKSYYIEKSSISLKNENCKTTTQDMETIEECIFKNTDIKECYSKLILNNEITDSEHLNKILPEKSRNYTINKNGIIDIEYKILARIRVEITMNYQGGVTIIEFQQVKDNVKRLITYSAD